MTGADDIVRILLALAVSAALGAVIEAFSPSIGRSGRLSRAAGGGVAACGLYVAYLVVFYRPILAAEAAVTTMAILHVISYLKMRLLREPLVFSDFALLRNVLAHPQIYYADLHHAPLAPVVAAALSINLVAMIALERTVLVTGWAAAGTGVVGLIGVMLFAFAVPRTPPIAALARRLAPKPDLSRDVERLGLTATLVLYAVRWMDDRHTKRAPRASIEASPRRLGTTVEPEFILVVQLESFIDPQRLKLPAEMMPPMLGLACVRRHARLWGDLVVPAHGAYTMRSEASVLTGLEPAELGFEAFDPYLSVGVPRVASLAEHFKARGYSTTFVHPFFRDFFRRDRVMPALGFEALITVESFAECPRHGPFVSDPALADRLVGIVAASTRSFVFAVSMENHGPWPPGRLEGCSPGTPTWLAHVVSTDEALGRLLDGLQRLDRPGILCVYGDHPPTLPGMAISEGRPVTDFAVVEFGRDRAHQNTPEMASLTAAQLGRIIARCADGWRPATANSALEARRRCGKAA